MNTVIEVCSKDPEDNMYCAIVMEWHEQTNDYVNSGIVVREFTSQQAFTKARIQAIKYGLWE